MRRHAVCHGTHHVFAYAAVEIGSTTVSSCEGREPSLVVGGRLQVGAGDQPLRHAVHEGIVDLGGHEYAAGRRRGFQSAELVVIQPISPARRQFTTEQALELSPLRIGQRGHTSRPFFALATVACSSNTPRSQHLTRDFERLCLPRQVAASLLRILGK